MNELLLAVVVFTGIYFLIKVFTDFLLKRKIIKAGHIDTARILETPKNGEENSFPTLKWGLVILFAGLGLLVISIVSRGRGLDWERDGAGAYLQIGIELISISLGFLLYFVISQFKKK